MKLKVTVLGCGNAAGVPSIGNHWGQCDPTEPRNRRTRASIAVASENSVIVVDTGPDFKAQINDNNIEEIDAVLYSHAHSDHVNGIDDLRVLRLRHKKVIPVYGNAVTLSDIMRRFDYMFSEIDPEGLYPQVCAVHTITEAHMGHALHVEGIPVVPFVQSHGSAGNTLGFRFGDLAYSTDMQTLDDAAINAIRGIHTWIVDAGAYKMPHNYVHANLKKVFELNEQIQARQVYLTHMPGFMDYRTLVAELPSGYAPAYDGLQIDVEA